MGSQTQRRTAFTILSFESPTPAAYVAEENVRNACKADAGMLIANPLPKG
jgi:hypothetical protein